MAQTLWVTLTMTYGVSVPDDSDESWELARERAVELAKSDTPTTWDITEVQPTLNPSA